MSEKILQTENGNIHINGDWKLLNEDRYESARSNRQIESTGANVLDKDGNVVGIVPEQPINFELSNMEYSPSMDHTISFLDAYSFDKTIVLMREDHNYSYNHTNGYELDSNPNPMAHYQERVDALLAERSYIDDLAEWALSFEEKDRKEQHGTYFGDDDAQPHAMFGSDYIMQKIKNDMMTNRLNKERYVQKLKESGIEIDNPVSQGIIADYDKKHGAMFRINESIDKKFNNFEKVQ